MSYCRWSSMNWQCDLYCYGSDRGFETHVAARRVVGNIPKEPDWRLLLEEDVGGENVVRFAAQHNAVMDWLKTAERTPIGLLHDGESFVNDTLEGFLDTLLTLRAAGYRFPDSMLDEVREEIAAFLQSSGDETS